jgi:hypothetical protein
MQRIDAAATTETPPKAARIDAATTTDTSNAARYSSTRDYHRSDHRSNRSTYACYYIGLIQ